ncbi:hypothetical protein ILYODFUR_023157 [Ilyodon furcidens]|uniref:Uncharacterized protein n=1 Tax=Ilyodon furcidens TaxID=33524 RepID=A0ABV0UUE7_9TELE
MKIKPGVLWTKCVISSFCLSRNASLLRRPVRHAGNGNESLFSSGFIIPSDIRAAMSVELRMFNCATKIDDSNRYHNYKDDTQLIITMSPSDYEPIQAFTVKVDTQNKSMCGCVIIFFS